MQPGPEPEPDGILHVTKSKQGLISGWGAQSLEPEPEDGCVEPAPIKMAEGQDGAVLYAELVERARALPYYATAWPPKRDRRQQPVGLLPNRIETMPEKAATIGRHAAGAAPLADARLVPLLRGWLELKASAGSSGTSPHQNSATNPSPSLLPSEEKSTIIKPPTAT